MEPGQYSGIDTIKSVHTGRIHFTRIGGQLTFCGRLVLAEERFAFLPPGDFFAFNVCGKCYYYSREAATSQWD